MTKKDKIIDLLKIESGLKGELVNIILEIPGMTQVLAEKGVLQTIKNCIDESNKAHAEVLKLEQEDESNETKPKN